MFFVHAREKPRGVLWHVDRGCRGFVQSARVFWREDEAVALGRGRLAAHLSDLWVLTGDIARRALRPTVRGVASHVRILARGPWRLPRVICRGVVSRRDRWLRRGVIDRRCLRTLDLGVLPRGVRRLTDLVVVPRRARRVVRRWSRLRLLLSPRLLARAHRLLHARAARRRLRLDLGLLRDREGGLWRAARARLLVRLRFWLSLSVDEHLPDILGDIGFDLGRLVLVGEGVWRRWIKAQVGGRGDVCGVLGCREVGRLLLWLRLRRRRLLLLLALSPSLPREQLCSQLEVVELLGSLGLRRLLPCLLPTRISTL